MKDTKDKNIFKKIVLCLIGVIVGYLLYYNVFMEIIPLFFSFELAYIVVSIACLIGCIVGCIIVLSVLINKKINKWLFVMICIAYFVVMSVALFFRNSLERVFVFNPLIGLKDTFADFQMLMQSVMNLILFVPLGFFLRNKKVTTQVLIAFVVSVGIELLQVGLMRGFFDTFDIILYFIGIMIGSLIFKKYKLKIE